MSITEFNKTSKQNKANKMEEEINTFSKEKKLLLFLSTLFMFKPDLSSE